MIGVPPDYSGLGFGDLVYTATVSASVGALAIGLAALGKRIRFAFHRRARRRRRQHLS